jgi:hypothetical protein
MQNVRINNKTNVNKVSQRRVGYVNNENSNKYLNNTIINESVNNTSNTNNKFVPTSMKENNNSMNDNIRGIIYRLIYYCII